MRGLIYLYLVLYEFHQYGKTNVDSSAGQRGGEGGVDISCRPSTHLELATANDSFAGAPQANLPTATTHVRPDGGDGGGGLGRPIAPSPSGEGAATGTLHEKPPNTDSEGRLFGGDSEPEGNEWSLEKRKSASASGIMLSAGAMNTARRRNKTERVANDLLLYESADPHVSYDMRYPPSPNQLKFPRLQREYNDDDLAQLATNPPVDYMRLLHPLLPRYIGVYQSQSNGITVRDVVSQLFSALQEQISSSHYDNEDLDSARRERIVQAGALRTHGSEEEKANGIRMVDYLEDKFERVTILSYVINQSLASCFHCTACPGSMEPFSSKADRPRDALLLTLHQRELAQKDQKIQRLQRANNESLKRQWEAQQRGNALAQALGFRDVFEAQMSIDIAGQEVSYRECLERVVILEEEVGQVKRLNEELKERVRALESVSR
ncbi:hypothetical protein C0992_005232 [Termitomyces sp. T32_za158]|nr:hypothetical protein C0992_005232 [Termitomyces sp. T32_za158]